MNWIFNTAICFFEAGLKISIITNLCEICRLLHLSNFKTLNLMPLSADMIYVVFRNGSKILTDNEKSKTRKYPASIAKNISFLLANALEKYFEKTI